MGEENVRSLLIERVQTYRTYGTVVGVEMDGKEQDERNPGGGLGAYMRNDYAAY